LRPTELARGPWSPDAQHGGAPAALLARALEGLEGEPELVTRLTVEFLRPVPLAPLAVRTEVLRPGSRVQLLGASLLADDVEVCHAAAVRIRRTAEPVANAPREAGTDRPAGPQEGTESPAAERFAGTFVEAFEQRWLVGDYDEPGPATVWMRLRGALVDAEEPSPLVRTVAAADFGNGVSSVLDWDTHRFINPDLTVYLDRPAAGEWVCLDARTHVDPHGTGTAESVLHDRRGRIGRALQSLFVDRAG
jgi:hypothetical protein